MKPYFAHILAFFMFVLLTACGGGNKDKTPDPYIVSMESSAYTNCIGTRDGIFKCWGYGDNYSFANGLGETISDDATEVGAGIPAAQLGDMAVLHAETNENFGCALYENNLVKCWGNDRYIGRNDPTVDTSSYTGDVAEELGNNLPTIDFGTDLTVSQLSLGNSHACVILNNGGLKCWGSASNGRLGSGNTNNSLGDGVNAADEAVNEMGNALPYVDLGTDANQQPYTAKQVMAGYDVTCAILSNDQIKCWGDNGSAQLGYGDFNDRGDEPNEMGNNLPFVDLGTGRSANKVFAYYHHTCAIMDNGGLKCWGTNGDGEIGIASGDNYVGNNVVPNSSSTYCSSPDQAYLYTKTSLPVGDEICPFGGSQYMTGMDINGNSILEESEASLDNSYCNSHDLTFITTEIILAAGSEECGDTSGFKITGDYDNNGDGELSNGTDNAMGDNLPEINFASNSPVVDVVLGDDHTCALLADHTLKCWGDNSYGQAGLDIEDEWGNGVNETPANRTSPNLGTDAESGEDLYPVAISGSYTYSCAVLNNDTVKCWGYDEDYATLGVPEYFDEYIGNGEAEDEAGEKISVIEMGNNLKAVELFSTNAAVIQN
jgi:alpha-tubulin suppressor-like RCC1 family protein